MKDQNRLLIAFVLSLLVIIFFSSQGKDPKQAPISSASPPVSVPSSAPSVSPPSSALPALPHSSEDMISEVCAYSEKPIPFSTALYTAEIDPIGGKIVSFGLRHFLRRGEDLFMLFDRGITLSEFFPFANGEPTYCLDLSKSPDLLTMEASSNGLLLKKKIETSSSGYSWNSSLSLYNSSSAPVDLRGSKITLASISSQRKRSDLVAPEMTIFTGNEIHKVNVQKISRERISGTALVLKGRSEMFYFKVMKPVEFFVENSAGVINCGFTLPEHTLLPDSSLECVIRGYIGPSDYFIARQEIHDPWVFGTGLFAGLGRILFFCLRAIHTVARNWGLSIILLTLLVKALFFPLTRTSLRSMKQMQKLRPYMQDIQKKYKGDSQMMQKEMMNLYKTYKINPFGGCLPALVQFPIFIGFFLALRNSLYLRGSRFLWIQDLSVPDTIFTAGSIPINLLPILMFVTSFLQQRMTPQMDQSQKMMNYLFPVMMLFLFYNFSAGLLLYWVTMNIAGIAEQYYSGKTIK